MTATPARRIRGTRIAINEEGRTVKVTMIVPFRDGGVAVAAPYTTARRGLLMATQFPDRPGNVLIPIDDFVVEYSASDRVKLSMHRDGFTQFSGTGIRSGREPDGTPKGLAIQMRRPFMYPIQTGPTFAVTLWGLSDFETLRRRDAADALVFDERDFYYRGASAETWNAYVIEGFVFPADLLRHVVPRGRRRSFLPILHRHYAEGSGRFDFRVMILPNQSVFLGFLVSRIRGEWIASDRHLVTSGFELAGPRDMRGVGLSALYPTPYVLGEEPAASLDWRASNDPSEP